MKKYKVEKVWPHNGNVCVVIMARHGHRCGYVGIKPTHPLYGHDYSEHSEYLADLREALTHGTIGKRGIIPLVCWNGKKMSPEILFDVHGGITYSGDGKGEYPIKMKDVWWFGYDCAHAGDAKDKRYMSQFMLDLERKYPTGGVLRSLKYCISECESLSNQLEDLK